MDLEIATNSHHDNIISNRTVLEQSFDQLDLIGKSLVITEKTLGKAERQSEFSRELYKMGRISLINMQQSMSRYYNAKVSHISKLKEKHVLIAKILYLANIDLDPAANR